MSIHVMSAVYQARLGSTTRKAILLKMADHSNDDGGSIFVGVDRIARETEVADRTVQRVLRKLEAKGLLVVEKPGGKGPRSTTHYCIDLEKLSSLPRASDPKGDKKSPKRKTRRVTLKSSKGDTDDNKGDTVSPEPSITIKEPSKNRPKAANDHRDPGSPPTAAISEVAQSSKKVELAPTKQRRTYSEDFEAFWKAYPSKINNSKKNAFAEWRRLSAEDRDSAMASLPAYQRFLAKRPDHPTIHAERYLKHARFEGFAAEVEAERRNAWECAITAYMLGDDWKAPEWKGGCPSPETAGFPLAVEQVRGLVQSMSGWAWLLDKYVAGDSDAEDPFNRIRPSMFEEGQRERLVAARGKAQEDRKLAAEELRRTAALQRESSRAEREAREGEKQEQAEQDIARKRASLLRQLEKRDVDLQNLQPGNWRISEVSNERRRLQEELNRIGV